MMGQKNGRNDFCIINGAKLKEKSKIDEEKKNMENMNNTKKIHFNL